MASQDEFEELKARLTKIECLEPTKGGLGKTIGMWTLGLMGAFIAFVVIVNIVSPPEANPSERIKASCEREFGVDTPEATNCQISLSIEYVAKAKEAEMDRARRGAN